MTGIPAPGGGPLRRFGWIGPLGSALAWVAFPLAPTALATAGYSILNVGGSDPRAWGRGDFVLILGPFAGFSYLAGAASILPDPPGVRGLRRLRSRRALWVTLGPWVGFGAVLAWAAAAWAIDRALAATLPADRLAAGRAAVAGWSGRWGIGSASGLVSAAVVLSYGWVVVAIAAAVRAGRAGRLLGSIGRGLAASGAFLGSLVGGFWAATAAFRAYFFDPRIAGIALVGLVALGPLSGCAAQPTVGDLRRRELFQAMAASWVLGLAILWRWLARDRRG